MLLVPIAMAVMSYHAVDRSGTPTATTFPPSFAAPHVSLAVMGEGQRQEPPAAAPSVAFQTSSINVKRANSGIKLGASFAYRGAESSRC